MACCISDERIPIARRSEVEVHVQDADIRSFVSLSSSAHDPPFHVDLTILGFKRNVMVTVDDPERPQQVFTDLAIVVWLLTGWANGAGVSHDLDLTRSLSSEPPAVIAMDDMETGIPRLHGEDRYRS